MKKAESEEVWQIIQHLTDLSLKVIDYQVSPSTATLKVTIEVPLLTMRSST